MSGWADLERLFRPATTTVALQLDGGVAARLAQLRRAVAEARAAQAQEANGFSGLGDTDPVAVAERELEDARAAAAATEVVFHLQAISYAALEELRLACPPTKAQREEGMAWDDREFAPRLVAACLTEPQLSDTEVAQLFDRFSSGQVNTLFRAAWELCNSSGQVVAPLSVTASARTPATAPS